MDSSSPFTSRFDSNYVATDSESLEIQSLLELPTSRLKVLTTRLQELEEQSLQIRNEQSALHLFISKHRALLSPIRKLPTDILIEIFIACLPIDYNHVMSRWEPPILLTQICSSWRTMAHATPQLWKSIHISAPSKLWSHSTEYRYSSPTTADYDRHSEAVVEWLTRSAACPLDISLKQTGFYAVDKFYYKIIDSLIRFSERWREVRLSTPYEALVLIASLPPSKVPLLETLSLTYSLPYAPPDFDFQSVWITGGVLKAPNLRDFDLCLAHLNYDVTRFPINWSQLTNISLHGSSWGSPSSPLSISRAYGLLSLCPNLITCRLEIGHTTEYNGLPFEIPIALISLPFLTRLSVREVNTSLSGLFSLLHLPSLAYIEFHTTIQPTEQSSTSLLSLLTRFQNTIQLITDAEFFTRQDFIKCLRLCPLLKWLYIEKPYGLEVLTDSPSCKVDDAFLKLFFERSNDEGYLCPHLEDFESSSNTAFSETTLLQFVKEKNGDSTNTTTGLAKLKYLVVSFNGASHSDIKQELEHYKQAGLVASIRYHTPYAAYPLIQARAPPTFGGLPGYSRAGLYLKSAFITL